MKILFIRHGKAAPYCDDDAGRALTDFGKKQANQTADYVLNHFSPDLIISSPFLRAYQTAKILHEKLINQSSQKSLKFLTLDSITPDDDPKKAIIDIEHLIEQELGQIFDSPSSAESCVVVVCHMPIIAKLASILDGLPVTQFELAECRALKSEIFSPNLATQIDAFIPQQNEAF